MLKLELPEKYENKVNFLRKEFDGNTRRMWIRRHSYFIFNTLNLEPQEASKFYAYISGRKPVNVHFI